MMVEKVQGKSSVSRSEPGRRSAGPRAPRSASRTSERICPGGSARQGTVSAAAAVEIQGTGSVFATTAVEHTRQRHCFNHDGSGARKAKAVNQPRRQWKHKAKAAAYDEFEGVGPARRVLEPGLRVLGRAETVCTWRCSLVLENVLCVVTPKKERVTA